MNSSGMIGTRNISRLACGLAAVHCLALFALPAPAAEIYSGDDLTLRWDNTLRYTAAFRVSPQNAALISQANGDDGDRNFAPGLVSNRLSLLSVVDASKDNLGIHASMEAWYDTVYSARTDNSSPATCNAASVPNSRFPRATRNLMGRHAEFLDAFAFANLDIAGSTVSLRVGRQNLLWGESLFFDPNSIAAAQAPYDYIKGNSTLTDYAKSVYMPVSQAALTVQPDPALSLSFYYQFEWRASRLPAAGSYFSYLDTYGAGAERLLQSGGQYLARAPDEEPPAGGQYGVALHANLDDVELGIYALRYHAKYPFLKSSPGAAGPPGSDGLFNLEYQSGIQLYGISFSGYIGDSSLAAEFSVRRHMPLTSSSYFVTSNIYAEGDVVHAQTSSEISFTASPLWDSANLSVEAAADYLLGITQNKAALNPSRDPFSMRLRALFEPRLYEVAPNLAVSFPVGIGYTLTGRSDTSYYINGDSGDLTMGVSVAYQTVWRAELSLTSYLGSAGRQPLADRDFIAFSIERTF